MSINKINYPKIYPLPPIVVDFLRVLLPLTEEVYLVGGSLRDYLLGLKNKDYDLAIDRNILEVASFLIDHGIRVIETGIKFGSITAYYKHTIFEITQFRIDGKYNDNRHPEEVSLTSSVKDDASRRDYTINALYSKLDGIILDFYHGMEDLSNRILRCIGDADDRFNEDALRILRGIRFASKYQLTIEEETFASITRNVTKLTKISKERINKELMAIITNKNILLGISLLDKSTVYDLIFSPYNISYNISNFTKNIKDNFFINFTLLFYHNNLNNIKKFLRDYKFSNDQIKLLSCLIECVNDPLPSVKTKLSRIHSLTYTHSDGNINLKRYSKVLQYYFKIISSINKSRSKEEKKELEYIRENNIPYLISDLKITGQDLINIFSLSGKALGDILNNLYNHILNFPKDNEFDILISLVRNQL